MSYQVSNAAKVVVSEGECNAQLGNWDHRGNRSLDGVEDERDIAINSHCNGPNTKTSLEGGVITL